jgi:hypothetical protein
MSIDDWELPIGGFGIDDWRLEEIGDCDSGLRLGFLILFLSAAYC